MAEKFYRRAVYDVKREAFDPPSFIGVDLEPDVWYRLTMLETDDLERWMGGIEKFWTDDEASEFSEFYQFGEYGSEPEFKQAVDQMREIARKSVVSRNIDELLALIDVIK